MPRESKSARASKRNGEKAFWWLIEDRKITCDELIAGNASDFWNRRLIINPENMSSCVCWFEGDPNSMVDPNYRYIEIRRSISGMTFWDELAQDDDEDDLDMNMLDKEADEKIEQMREKRWRPSGHNSNVRGAGTGRATYFAHQSNERSLARDANAHSQPITGFFTRATSTEASLMEDEVIEEDLITDDQQPNDRVEDEEYEFRDDEFDDLFGPQDHVPATGRASAVAVKLTVEQGIKKLNDSGWANPSRSVAKEKKIELMAWQRVQAQAVLSYLENRKEGQGKMEASANVAKVLFSKKGTSSYKSRTIRFWAAQFLLTGILPTYAQGQHVKTKSIIADEHVQHRLKEHLRAMKDYHRRTCTYNFKDLQRELPITYTDRLPLEFVQRAFTYCLRFMNGYREGLVGPELDYAVKKYKGHRCIPVGQKEMIKQEFAMKCGKNAKSNGLKRKR